MTCAELIAKLSEFDGKMPVAVFADGMARPDSHIDIDLERRDYRESRSREIVEGECVIITDA